MKKIIRNKNIRFSYTREIEKNETFCLFLYNPKNGKDYVLNRLSALIWEIIQQPMEEKEIVNILIRKLAISDEKVLKIQVNKIIKILKKQDLINLENNETKTEK